MAEPDPPSPALLMSVIQTLQRELETRRREADEAREEIKRLVAMVEGLTLQLDALLRDRDEERRAELAKLRAVSSA